MRFHIRVIPAPEEPLILTADRADRAQEWLETRVHDCRFEMCAAFPQTGGFVLLTVPDDDETQARARVEAIFADYPLRSSIIMEVNVVLPTLKDGFDVLRAAIAAQRRIGE